MDLCADLNFLATRQNFERYCQVQYLLPLLVYNDDQARAVEMLQNLVLSERNKRFPTYRELEFVRVTLAKWLRCCGRFDELCPMEAHRNLQGESTA